MGLSRGAVNIGSTGSIIAQGVNSKPGKIVIGSPSNNSVRVAGNIDVSAPKRSISPSGTVIVQGRRVTHTGNIYANGRSGGKIKVLSTENLKLDGSLFATGNKIDYNQELPVRKSGCAALDMAYVASGRYDGYFQKNLNLWDIAAGIIIVKEAGGILNEINLSNIREIKIIASNNSINNNLLEKLKNF